MRVAVDTNVVIRFLVADDASQHRLAREVMETADGLVFPILTLCETVWVLTRRYQLTRAEIAAMLRALIQIDVAEFDRAAVEAGLVMLDSGGDFADGVIAHQGQAGGADIIVSFDRKAVGLLEQAGQPVRLLA